MSKRKPYQLTEPSTQDVGSPVYWRSADELEAQLAKNPALQARLDAASATEFGPGDAEGAFNDPVSRRNFLNIMGASIALGTLEACRRPVEHIVPYARPDEHVNIGVPNHYATVMDQNGEALGLLVESHEGRPTKIEGNPDHPSSRGGADLKAQSSVLDLYDPDRARKPVERSGETVTEKTYAEFETAFSELLEANRADQGAHLRVLARPTISPTFIRLRAAVMERYPRAKFYTYESAGRSNAREGLKLALGAPANAVHSLQNARVVLAVDADFLETEAGVVRDTRGFADSRRMHSAADPMSRLYVVESGYSLTGANADHRLRLAAKDVGPYLSAVASRLVTTHHIDLGAVGAALRAEAPAGAPAKWIEAVAADLAANRGTSAVMVGPNQPAWVHALACAVNHALGNVGRTVNYHAPADPNEPDAISDLRALVDELSSNAVQTLVILGGNPVYEAPADLNLNERLASVPNVVQVSSHHDETSHRAKWHLPEAHYLESWGDALALDGVYAIQQPLIAPLHGAKSHLEVLGHMAYGVPRSAYGEVRETLRTNPAAAVGGFDRAWRRILHKGIVEGSSLPAVTGPVRLTEIGPRIQSGLASVGAAVGASNLEVTFRPCPKMHDGRHANVSWLQELPDTITKICWDNAALISPALARAQSISNGDKIRLSKGNKSIEIVAWIVMGQPDHSIGLSLGWGRTKAGRVGTGKGFDVNPLRSSDAMWSLDGVTLAKTGTTYPISQTQEHQRMEGRPLAIEATHAEYEATPNFAERLSHTPRTLPLWREVEYNGYKWGMVVDLTTCTGCSACVVACQAENNIPVVGKDQVSRGREMYWLRMDRYFVSPRGQGDHDELATSEPLVAFQPVACVQCEEAPCENVCPVNATAHSPEGLNDMAYNRCIGTRYCSNNCPYKVRRFNYLNWHNDGPWQETVGEWLSDSNVPETLRMQHNPNVSVRFRGVMEKCTYCVQRIQTAKIQAKNEYRTIRDGEVTPACAQTCSAQSITFGDLNDRDSRVARAFRTDRRFKLLAEIGTQPRTTYLAKVRNPNPEMQG